MSDQTPVPIEPKKERKERFQGEIDLGGFESSTVNLAEMKKAGRPEEVDYSPYIRMVEENYALNKDRPASDKISAGKTWKRQAVGVVKSRFGVAATRCQVGLNWIEKDLDTNTGPDGMVQLDFVAGERTYRPRKAKENGETQTASEESTTEATEDAAPVADGGTTEAETTSV
jgi:hypothetical protein